MISSPDVTPEYLFAEIKPPGAKTLLVAVVYRPPKATNLSVFATDYDKFTIDYDTTIILGDFNANQLGNAYEAMEVRQFCNDRALYLVPYFPTCHMHASDTLLDLCILSDRELLSSYGQSSVLFIACHDLIYVILRVRNLQSHVSTYRARAYGQLNHDTFCDDLFNRDWNDLIDSQSVDEMARCLQGHIKTVLDQHAPYITHPARSKIPPWISPELKNLCRSRDRLYRAYKRTKALRILHLYRSARNDLHIKIKASRSNYYAARLSGITNSRTLWKELRNLGIAHSSSSNVNSFSPDELNAHFARVAQWPSSAGEVRQFLDSLTQSVYSDSLFYFEDISPDNLLTALMHFSSQSRGVDNLSLRDIIISLPAIQPYQA
ncbi:hypothetical protein KPH14_011618 [Odynerus spinipes]|uniref:Endonuclease/exonuclease/phosphatase domain-containing protein n=1 Tax=Odynerus spinipes TaxID=1348599 RepID=A0AAD9VLV8_9HYME|nr:hypothetical protein KPH14_011618 [Odynerus spinipes]